MRRKLERELAMQAIGALFKHQSETSISRFK
jgi:hypothetical protein